MRSPPATPASLRPMPISRRRAAPRWACLRRWSGWWARCRPPKRSNCWPASGNRWPAGSGCSTGARCAGTASACSATPAAPCARPGRALLRCAGAVRCRPLARSGPLHAHAPSFCRPEQRRRALLATLEPSVKLRTYFVEDNATIRENLIGTLEELASVQAVGVAETEDAGKEWLTTHAGQWDLAIVDLFLRQGNGLGVLAACRARRPGQKIVVLSNYATPDVRMRCTQLGGDAVFDKSNEIDALVAYCVLHPNPTPQPPTPPPPPPPPAGAGPRRAPAPPPPGRPPPGGAVPFGAGSRRRCGCPGVCPPQSIDQPVLERVVGQVAIG